MRHSPAPRVSGGARIFHRMFTRLGCHGRPPQFVVEFYPYANLVHTIRLRDDTAFVRLSDLLRGAPLPVLEAAAAILLGNLYRTRPPRDLAQRYREFVYSHETRRRLAGARRLRARSEGADPCGRHHDLAFLFRNLNRRYFASRLPRPRLGWSRQPWLRQLGIFDPALNQILINNKLDRDRVPSFVVAYVLYHEMLHLKHPQRIARCRLESHSAAFRREERRFLHYRRALRFLTRFR